MQGGRSLLEGREGNAALVSSPIFGMTLPQQPALQLTYDMAPIGLVSFVPTAGVAAVPRALC